MFSRKLTGRCNSSARSSRSGRGDGGGGSVGMSSPLDGRIPKLVVIAQPHQRLRIEAVAQLQATIPCLAYESVKEAKCMFV